MLAAPKEFIMVLGGLATAAMAQALPASLALSAPLTGSVLVCGASAVAGALWVMLAGWLRQYRGINETISSLLLGYIAIALFKHFVEGPMRDPASLNKPSTRPLGESLRIGPIMGSGGGESLLGDVHWGLVIGVVLCIAAGLWLSFTASGFALRVVGGNARAARLVGLPSNQLIVVACAAGYRAADDKNATRKKVRFKAEDVIVRI